MGHSEMALSGKEGHHTNSRDSEHGPSTTRSRSSAQEPEPAQVAHAALDYYGRGWSPIPIDPSSKRPLEPNWVRARYSEAEIRDVFPVADPERNVVPPNVGIVLGEISGGLVVADLDHIDADIARFALPATELIDGRPGNPDSHWFYRVERRLPKTECTSPATGRKIIELLGDGQQVVVPPSRHPSGETRSWSSAGEPTAVDADELIRSVRRACACQELRNIWPEPGARHNVALALAGALLRADMDESEVEGLLDLLWTSAERGQIEGIVRITSAKLGQADQHVTGWPSLVKLLGDEHKASLAQTIAWLGIDDVDISDPRPRLSAVAGDLHVGTLSAWDALRSRNDPPRLFVRSGAMVRIEHDPDGRPIVEELSQDRLRWHLSAEIRWTKPAGKGIPPKPAPAPLDIVRNMLATPSPPLPPVKAVVSAPILSPDGTICIEPGYNAASRTFYQPLPGVEIPAIPDRPTRAEIEAAKTLLLDDMLADFPFESQAERANALAMFLLPFGREVIDGHTPFHFVEAPRAGTGKSKLAHLATILVCGPSGAASISETTDDEEWRKRITSALMLGSPFIFIDNVTRPFTSPQLAKAVTEAEWSDRKLGGNEQVVLPVRCVWIVTANNAAVNVDIARRSMRIRLNAKVEDPFNRDVRAFRHPDLEKWATDNRGRLIAACLTLWRAWIVAGKPDGGAVLGSFEAWAATMSGVLQVAGVEGFLTNARNFVSLADAETSHWHELIDGWWERFGSDRVRTKELYDEVGMYTEGFAYGDKRPDGKVTAFGMELRGQRGTLYGEIEIVFEKVNDKPVYRLQRADGATRARQSGARLPTPMTALKTPIRLAEPS